RAPGPSFTPARSRRPKRRRNPGLRPDRGEIESALDPSDRRADPPDAGAAGVATDEEADRGELFSLEHERSRIAGLGEAQASTRGARDSLHQELLVQAGIGGFPFPRREVDVDHEAAGLAADEAPLDNGLAGIRAAVFRQPDFGHAADQIFRRFDPDDRGGEPAALQFGHVEFEDRRVDRRPAAAFGEDRPDHPAERVLATDRARVHPHEHRGRFRLKGDAREFVGFPHHVAGGEAMEDGVAFDVAALDDRPHGPGVAAGNLDPAASFQRFVPGAVLAVGFRHELDHGDRHPFQFFRDPFRFFFRVFDVDADRRFFAGPLGVFPSHPDPHPGHTGDFEEFVFEPFLDRNLFVGDFHDEPPQNRTSYPDSTITRAYQYQSSIHCL